MTEKAWMTFMPDGTDDDVWYTNPEGKLPEGYTYQKLNPNWSKEMAQPEQEPLPNLYVKDINGNFHPYKEKGHTENCAAFGDDCSENHLPTSRVGVGENDYTAQPEPVGYIDHADGSVVWLSKPATGVLLYTTPPQRKPLTLHELSKIFASIPSIPFDGEWQLELVRAVEAAHGIKE